MWAITLINPLHWKLANTTSSKGENHLLLVEQGSLRSIQLDSLVLLILFKVTCGDGGQNGYCIQNFSDRCTERRVFLA